MTQIGIHLQKDHSGHGPSLPCPGSLQWEESTCTPDAEKVYLECVMGLGVSADLLKIGLFKTCFPYSGGNIGIILNYHLGHVKQN